MRWTRTPQPGTEGHRARHYRTAHCQEIPVNLDAVSTAQRASSLPSKGSREPHYGSLEVVCN